MIQNYTPIIKNIPVKYITIKDHTQWQLQSHQSRIRQSKQAQETPMSLDRPHTPRQQLLSVRLHTATSRPTRPLGRASSERSSQSTLSTSRPSARLIGSDMSPPVPTQDQNTTPISQLPFVYRWNNPREKMLLASVMSLGALYLLIFSRLRCQLWLEKTTQ